MLFCNRLFSGSTAEALAQIKNWIEQSETVKTLVCPNPEQVVQLTENDDFRTWFYDADILIPDGTALVLACNWLATCRASLGFASQVITIQRIPGADLVNQLLVLATHQNWRVAVIGGRWDSQTQVFDQELQVGSATCSVKVIPGYQHYPDSGPVELTEEVAVMREINQFKPTIVLVALGAPKQERWLQDHRGALSAAQVKVALAVGGSLDYLTGKVQRAPSLLRTLGLEWLWRLILEPWRWRRQSRLLVFVWAVGQATLSLIYQRLRGKSGESAGIFSWRPT